MSISDGLGPSIFCQKMEKARPKMEDVDGKVVHFLPESAFLNFDVLMSNVIFPYLYFDLAGKQICFPQGKSINRRNQNTRDS